MLSSFHDFSNYAKFLLCLSYSAGFARSHKSFAGVQCRAMKWDLVFCNSFDGDILIADFA
jgi:hypothetical protein